MPKNNNITLAIALPWSGDGWPVGEGISPAALKAIRDANNDPEILPDHHLNFVFVDSRCDKSVGPKIFEAAYHLFSPDVFIGPACSSVTDAIFEDQDKSVSSWKLDIPMISYSAASPMFGDKDLVGPHSGEPSFYSPFSRTVPDYTMQNTALVSMLGSYGIEKLGIIYTKDTGLWTPTHTDLVKEMGASLAGTEVESLGVEDGAFGTDDAKDDVSAFMTEAVASGTHAFLLLGYCGEMTQWTELAESANLLKGQAFFVYEFTSSCARVDEISAATGLAKYEGLWNLSPKPPSTIGDFKDSLTSDSTLDFSPYLTYPYGTANPNSSSPYASIFIDEMEREGGLNRTFTPGAVEPDDHAAYLHDAIRAYALSTHDIIEDMIQPIGVVDPFSTVDGFRLPVMTVSKFLRAETFAGASGNVVFNSRGNRKADVEFSFMKISEAGDQVERVASATFDFESDSIVESMDASSFLWPGGVTGGSVPGSTSNIVYGNGSSPAKIPLTEIVIAGVVIVLLAIYFIIIHLRKEKKLQQRIRIQTLHVSKLKTENYNIKRKLELSQAYSNKEKYMIAKQHSVLVEEFKQKKLEGRENSGTEKDDSLDSADATASLGKLLISAKELEAQNSIGKGSFGEVFKSKYRSSYVAVKTMKTIDEESLEKFRMEILLQSELRHDNIVAFIGAVWEQSLMALVIEYCEKGTAKSVLKTEERLTFQDPLLKWCLDISRGMNYIHSLSYFDVKANRHHYGIIHRDLKPDNCLITENFSLKLADFGEAREVDVDTTMTQVGTPLYVAPEVLKGYRYTTKADVYSFALTVLQFTLKKVQLHFFLQQCLANNSTGFRQTKRSANFITHKMVGSNWRPDISHIEDEESAPRCILDLINLCWLEDPNKRPTFEDIEKYLSREGKMAIFGEVETASGSSVRRSSASGQLSVGMRIAVMQKEKKSEEDEIDETKIAFWKARVSALEDQIQTKSDENDALREKLEQRNEERSPPESTTESSSSQSSNNKKKEQDSPPSPTQRRVEFL